MYKQVTMNEISCYGLLRQLLKFVSSKIDCSSVLLMSKNWEPQAGEMVSVLVLTTFQAAKEVIPEQQLLRWNLGDGSNATIRTPADLTLQCPHYIVTLHSIGTVMLYKIFCLAVQVRMQRLQWDKDILFLIFKVILIFCWFFFSFCQAKNYSFYRKTRQATV